MKPPVAAADFDCRPPSLRSNAPSAGLAPDRPPHWGKSAALTWLQTPLHNARVPPFVVIRQPEWVQLGRALLADLGDRLGCERFAVRSDGVLEDQAEASLAGHYRSHLAVAADRLAAAIDDVLATLPAESNRQVMVQAMVDPVHSAGVASTHRVHDGAPWYCMEMALADPRAVTAGQANGRMLALCRQSVQDGRCVPERMPPAVRAVLACLREIESRLPNQPFEIEFAFAAVGPEPGQLYLLQLRPLARAALWPPAQPLPALALADLQRADPCPAVLGAATVLSLMADWNPAELIGSHPRPLTRSLFQRLISCGSWWQARAQLGYQPPPEAGIDLLRMVAGRPYVDVRRSANSLLPAGLPSRTRQWLIDAWVAQLTATPAWHDKVEFEIYRSARDFTAESELERRWNPLLGSAARQDWEQRLTRISSAMMAAGRVLALCESLPPLLRASAARPSLIGLLENARAAAQVFAQLARLAFVGEAQLRSAQHRGALSPERCAELRRSKGSVGQLRHGQAEAAAWPAQLRPGNFDISRRALPLTDWARPDDDARSAPSFELSSAERRALAQLLSEAQLPYDGDAWLDFVRCSCQGREWGKFMLAQHLDTLLEAFALRSEMLGLSVEQASWLELDPLLAALREPGSAARSELLRSAEQAQAVHAEQARRILSPLLVSDQASWMADSLGITPNFIGQQRAEGVLSLLERECADAIDLSGRIVAIEQADPGYDWLFARGIRGLITAWGGAHSHMAIRCAEFGLPAAIGCGEAVFAQVRRARYACIDPSAAALWLH